MMKKMKLSLIQSVRHSIAGDLWRNYKLNRFRRRWVNEHGKSGSIPMNVFPERLVTIGKGSYGELNVITFSDIAKLHIGNFVSIAQNVAFLLDAEHFTNHISTYPFRVKMLQSEHAEAFGKGNITIDDDVWIGYGAVILSGVHIGQGAVIAAGSVVSSDIPAYAVADGIPAKVIKYRFDRETVDELLRIDFGRLNEKTVRENLPDLYREIHTADDIKAMKWLPYKKT